MSLSVAAAVLASTVQRQASLQSLDPACQVTNKPNDLVNLVGLMHYAT